MVLKELMRHASVTTTEKYYVGIQSDETSALLAGLMASGVAQGEHSPKKVNGEVNETKKGSRVIGNPLFFNVSAGTRTQDLRIKSPLLYQLSYAHKCRCLRRS